MKRAPSHTAAMLAMAVFACGTALPAAASGGGHARITVRDYATGSPLAGALVTVAGVSVTSGPDGVATLSGLPPNVQYVQVSEGAARCTYNSGITIADGKNVSRTVRLLRVSAAQRAWLAGVNADRAANGAPPVAFDETAQEAALEHARDMARHGYVSHWDTQGLKPYQRYASLGGVGAVNENIAAGFASWRAAQAAFMAERRERGGHYLNIVDPMHRWVGLAQVRDGDRLLFDQEFVTLGAVFDPTSIPSSVAVGATISIAFRSLGLRIFAASGAEPLPQPLSLEQLASAPYDGSYDTIASLGYDTHARASGTLLETGTITLQRAGSYLLPVIGAQTWLASVVVMAR